uniref:Uncharacterized protein n=1 Tax=Anopheles dirus TaxID=7168 RepID=A0A182NAI3_9DIPT
LYYSLSYFTNVLLFVSFADVSCVSLHQQPAHVVKEEEQITASEIADERLDGDDGERDEDDEEMMEKMRANMHSFGTSDGDGILTTAASLFEDTLGLSFGSSIAAVAGISSQGHQQSSFNDDLSLMVGRPDEDGYFHCPAESCDRKHLLKVHKESPGYY